METLDFLSTLEGHGTSMVTITIANSPKALDNILSRLHCEYSTANKIKCRI